MPRPALLEGEAAAAGVSGAQLVGLLEARLGGWISQLAAAAAAVVAAGGQGTPATADVWVTVVDALLHKALAAAVRDAAALVFLPPELAALTPMCLGPG